MIDIFNQQFIYTITIYGNCQIVMPITVYDRCVFDEPCICQFAMLWLLIASIEHSHRFFLLKWVLIAPIEHSPLGKNDKNVIYLSSNTYLICSSANQLPMEPRHEKTVFFAYAKTKTQISFAVTAKLISAFVFATQIVQSLYFLNTKFHASSHLL